MVKKYKKIEEETYCNYFCDVCGKQTHTEEIGWEDEEESFRGGQEGGYVKKYVYDICNDCMEKFIMPILKENIGKEWRIDEYEW